MVELTDDQWHEINAETPSRIRNPRTDETFVLIRAEVYEAVWLILSWTCMNSYGSTREQVNAADQLTVLKLS